MQPSLATAGRGGERSLVCTEHEPACAPTHVLKKHAAPRAAEGSLPSSAHGPLRLRRPDVCPAIPAPATCPCCQDRLWARPWVPSHHAGWLRALTSKRPRIPGLAPVSTATQPYVSSAQGSRDSAIAFPGGFRQSPNAHAAAFPRRLPGHLPWARGRAPLTAGGGQRGHNTPRLRALWWRSRVPTPRRQERAGTWAGARDILEPSLPSPTDHDALVWDDCFLPTFRGSGVPSSDRPFCSGLKKPLAGGCSPGRVLEQDQWLVWDLCTRGDPRSLNRDSQGWAAHAPN